MNDFYTGDQFGLHPSVKVHRLANIAGILDCGENSRIDAFVTITGKVKIGKNCHIGTGACIFGTDGAEIGDESSVSPGAKIFTGSFDAETRHLANPAIDSPVYFRGPVVIGKRCIVGCNSVILPNVVIDDDTCIGALTLVKANVSSGIYAGIPAKRKH
jgi:acetyltransferase-like isoleucine patch superfamily enzyme